MVPSKVGKVRRILDRFETKLMYPWPSKLVVMNDGNVCLGLGELSVTRAEWRTGERS